MITDSFQWIIFNRLRTCLFYDKSAFAALISNLEFYQNLFGHFDFSSPNKLYFLILNVLHYWTKSYLISIYIVLGQSWILLTFYLGFFDLLHISNIKLHFLSFLMIFLLQFRPEVMFSSVQSLSRP